MCSRCGKFSKYYSDFGSTQLVLNGSNSGTLQLSGVRSATREHYTMKDVTYTVNGVKYSVGEIEYTKDTIVPR